MEIVRLEITVDDSGGMRLLQGDARLDGEKDRPRRRQRAECLDEPRQIHPGEILHRDVVQPVLARAGVEDAHDVRTAESSRRLCLQLEASHGFWARGRAHAKNLQRDVALQ